MPVDVSESQNEWKNYTYRDERYGNVQGIELRMPGRWMLPSYPPYVDVEANHETEEHDEEDLLKTNASHIYSPQLALFPSRCSSLNSQISNPT